MRAAEEDFPSIVVSQKAPSSRKSTPKTPRPEFLEPLSPGPASAQSPWERIGLTEEEYTALQERVRNAFVTERKKEYNVFLLAEMEMPAFWSRRMDQLEKEREVFNKKWGWSAAELARVEQIDEELKECQEEFDRLLAIEDRLQYEYD